MKDSPSNVPKCKLTGIKEKKGIGNGGDLGEAEYWLISCLSSKRGSGCHYGIARQSIFYSYELHEESFWRPVRKVWLEKWVTSFTSDEKHEWVNSCWLSSRGTAKTNPFGWKNWSKGSPLSHPGYCWYFFVFVDVCVLGAFPFKRKRIWGTVLSFQAFQGFVSWTFSGQTLMAGQKNILT